MKNLGNKNLLKKLFVYITAYRTIFLFTGFLSVLLAFFALFRPLIIQYIVDNFIANSKAKWLSYATIFLIIMLVLETICMYFFTYLSSFVGQSVIKNIRCDVFKKITHFKLRYFDTNPVGKLVTRTVSDIETISEMISQGMLSIVGDIFKLLVILSYMFYTNTDLAFLVLIPMPLLILATNIFRKIIKKTFQDIRNRVSELNTFVQEHITGMSIVQFFNRQKREMRKFKNINNNHKEAYMTTIRVFSIFFALVDILSAASIAILMWYGFYEILEGLTTPGEIFSYILFVHILFRPIRQMADKFNVLQMGFISSKRVFDILDSKMTIENKGKTCMNDVKGNITFKNVWFAYKEEDWVLKDISLEIKSGQTVAIVGATGAGKSSLINILGRFYEYQKGQILVDGVELKDISLENLRSFLSIVFQDVFLFSDTIFNNITLFDKGITMKEVIESSKKVGTHEFISQLEGQYDYDVKERGIMLSTGQRQLISFLRAYVHSPNILILDEATSSIDSHSEEIIQHATEVITKNRTSLVIAHRLSTIRNADIIITLDKGKIIEQGSHSELMSKKGNYYNLYQNQVKKQELIM